MNVITSCPRCGADVLTTERDMAEGSDFLCEKCEDSLPGYYELVQAEARSRDADPDWQERQWGYDSVDVHVNIESEDQVVILDLERELWRFRGKDIDLLLLELESLLISLRSGAVVDKRHIEAAFDHIKLLKRSTALSA